MLQLYLGMSDSVVWVLPSLTVLRWAFDVWCFAALVQYRNTRRPVWAVLAGASVGAALVFSTDTGLYLAAAVAFYGICAAWSDGQAALRLRGAFASAAAVVVLLGGLAAAARGGVITGEFWSGWLEPFATTGAGSPRYLRSRPQRLHGRLLCAAGDLLSGRCRALSGRGPVPPGPGGRSFLGMFAVYGLMNLLHFVGRSVDGTLPRLFLPLVFVLAALGGDAFSRRRARIVTASVIVALLAALLLAPSNLLRDPVRAYPSLAAQAFRGRAPDGLCLIGSPKDVCGLPDEFAGAVDRFRAVAGRLETLAEQDRSVAIVDESGAVLYLASGQKPFGRYPRMFLNMYTTENLDRVTAALAGEEPDYVLTRATRCLEPGFGHPGVLRHRSPADTPYPDAWNQLLEEVRRSYTLEEELAPFELWVRRPSPGR